MSEAKVPKLNLARLRARTRARAKTESALSLPASLSDRALEIEHNDSDEDTPPLDTPPKAASERAKDPDELFVPVYWDKLAPKCYSHGAAQMGAQRASVQLDKRRSWRLGATSEPGEMAPRVGVSYLWQRPEVARRNTDTLNAVVAGAHFGWTALQNAARCGFGPVWRNLVWPRLAATAARGPLDLRALVRARGVSRADYGQLCMDVLRSVDTENATARIELALYQLLLAFCAHNPTFGYVQGMNMIAGVLAVNVDDATARFWLMDHVAHRIIPHYWRKSWLGVHADKRVLHYFLHNQRPRLAKHLKTFDTDDFFVHQVVLGWFSTLFSSVMRADCVYWLCDLVLVHGPVVLFETTLRLFIAHEQTIKTATNVSELFLYLSDYLGALQSLDSLLAIKLPKPITNAEVENRRAVALTAVLATNVDAVPYKDTRGCACARHVPSAVS